MTYAKCFTKSSTKPLSLSLTTQSVRSLKPRQELTSHSSRPRRARFDLVIGADGLHSRVRKIAFGAKEQFIRRLGNSYVAVFGMPNFLGLEHWEVLYQEDQTSIGAMIMGLRKDDNARAYVGFIADRPIEFDCRNIEAQKQLVADRVGGGGWVLPQIVEHMWRAPDFHFDSISQIRMDHWSSGRVVLVGDAGYSVALASGQGTTVAMVGAHVLAGELALQKVDLIAGIASYENELRAYVLRNQDAALEQNAKQDNIMTGESADADETSQSSNLTDSDFGQLVQPFTLKCYSEQLSLITVRR